MPTVLLYAGHVDAIEIHDARPDAILVATREIFELAEFAELHHPPRPAVGGVPRQLAGQDSFKAQRDVFE